MVCFGTGSFSIGSIGTVSEKRGEPCTFPGQCSRVRMMPMYMPYFFGECVAMQQPIGESMSC